MGEHVAQGDVAPRQHLEPRQHRLERLIQVDAAGVDQVRRRQRRHRLDRAVDLEDRLRAHVLTQPGTAEREVEHRFALDREVHLRTARE